MTDREVLRIPTMQGVPAAELARLMQVAEELWPGCEASGAWGGAEIKVTWKKPEPPRPTGPAALLAPTSPQRCESIGERGDACIRQAGHDGYHIAVDEDLVDRWDDEPEPDDGLAWSEDATHKDDRTDDF